MMQAKGWWKRWMAAGALLAAPALAWAQSADPHRWQLNMGRGVTASSQNAYEAIAKARVVKVDLAVGPKDKTFPFAFNVAGLDLKKS